MGMFFYVRSSVVAKKEELDGWTFPYSSLCINSIPGITQAFQMWWCDDDDDDVTLLSIERDLHIVLFSSLTHRRHHHFDSIHKNIIKVNCAATPTNDTLSWDWGRLTRRVSVVRFNLQNIKFPGIDAWRALVPSPPSSSSSPVAHPRHGWNTYK